MTTTQKFEPLVRNAEDAELRWFLGGGLHRWLVHEGEVGGRLLLFEDTVEAGKQTPLHTHPDAEETFYVLDGAIRLHLDGVEQQLRAGGVAVVPRDMPHAFMAQPDGARLLCLHTPGGGEDFYRAASEPGVPDQPALPPDFDRVRQASVETGSMRIVGPPPF